MLNLENNRALMYVEFSEPPSSIAVLVLAKRFGMKLEKLVNKTNTMADLRGPAIISYRIYIADALEAVDEINKIPGRRAWLDRII